MASLYSLYAKRRDANQEYNNEQEGKLASLQRQAMMDERQKQADMMESGRYANEQVDYAEKKNKEAQATISQRNMMSEIGALPPATNTQSAMERALRMGQIAEQSGDLDSARKYYDTAEKFRDKPVQPVKEHEVLEIKRAVAEKRLSPGEGKQLYDAYLQKQKRPDSSTYYNAVSSTGADGQPVFTQFGKTGQSPKVTNVGAPLRPTGGAASGNVPGKSKVRPEDITHALSLVNDLDKLLADNPRSTTGILSSTIRGIEAVGDAISPGSYSSNATIAEQKKEALLLAIKTVFSGKAFDSRDEQIRFEKAIGKTGLGTKAGMEEGSKDMKELLGKYRPPEIIGAVGSTPDNRKAEIDRRFDQLMNKK